jgi:hypothetical protein
LIRRVVLFQRRPQRLDSAAHFTAAESAGDHVETMNRSQLNRRVFDWLDGLFKASLRTIQMR